jgi:hypothetical protein
MISSHSGWFHRSGNEHGALRWVPAAKATGESTGSAGDNSGSDALADEPTATENDSPPLAGPYPVAEVNGRSPTGLDEFLGVTSFAVLKGDLTYRVFGTGQAATGTVRFQQQDLGWDGRDIRTWTITTTPRGIVAVPDDEHAILLDPSPPHQRR